MTFFTVGLENISPMILYSLPACVSYLLLDAYAVRIRLDAQNVNISAFLVYYRLLYHIFKHHVNGKCFTLAALVVYNLEMRAAQELEFRYHTPFSPGSQGKTWRRDVWVPGLAGLVAFFAPPRCVLFPIEWKKRILPLTFSHP